MMHNVVSVDGFIADDNDDVGPLHEWYFSGETPIRERDKRSTTIPEREVRSRFPVCRRSTSGPCGRRLARA
jgi:hypothetical protein